MVFRESLKALRKIFLMYRACIQWDIKQRETMREKK